MDTAKESGALGSKIIGSCGGGFMVTMVDDENKYKVKQAFMEAGAIAVYEIEPIN
ncbi:Galactokinase [Flagellimonas maritima]|uniref:Galactokinase n=2 Tax=Flagellimonas maritima TaxID=1383885 RepID=A0A2Z4LU28_9FLAO|nr:Galactokinase [Allomuricauda aurantiaca]